MTIQAFMPVLNEADVLAYTLRHLIGQGISVHVLDGWSSDGSWEIAEKEGATRERFPADRMSPYWECTPTLARIEQLARESKADWCLLNDADEFRYSNRPGETLAAAIARADRAGANVIDHRVFVFLPVDDGYQGEPESYFEYYTDDPKVDILCGLPQIKAWKNDGPVCLTSTGGHVAERPGRVLWDETLVLKHYPFRTQKQASERIRTRLARRCHAEHDKGWGVHYDVFTPETRFIRDRAALKRF